MSVGSPSGREPSLTTDQKLALFFREVWKVFVDGGALDSFDVHQIIEGSGLAEWRSCTAEEASRFDYDLEEGDAALFLTEEGKRVMAMAKQAEVVPHSSHAPEHAP